MKKLILASVSSIALLGLAACTDPDGTTTQSVPDQDPFMEQPAAPVEPAPEPAPADPID